MQQAWTPRRQGDAGEASAVSWFLDKEVPVFIPLAHTPSDYDLMVDLDGTAVRVQVKTSTRSRNGGYEVALCTRGGNQSWNGLVKRLDATRCDYVFVQGGDGRRWFIPAKALGGGTSILVGGPKYAEYEIEPGRPLRSRSDFN